MRSNDMRKFLEQSKSVYSMKVASEHNIVHDYYLNGEDHCNISRFIAHSCIPNCVVEDIAVGVKVIFFDNIYNFLIKILQGTKFLSYFATKNIAKGEEVTIDYKTEQDMSEEGEIPRKLENMTV